MENFEAALDSGAVLPRSPDARAKASDEWRVLVEMLSARKSTASQLE